MRNFVVLFAGAYLGCARPAYQCIEDSDCRSADGLGWCENMGYCSFVDENCESGRRYGGYSPASVANECVSAPDVSGTETVGVAETGAASTTGAGDTEPESSTTSVATAGGESTLGQVSATPTTGEEQGSSDEGPLGETSGGAETFGGSTSVTGGGATVEVCDGVDNDNDGLVDEYSPSNASCEDCRLRQAAGIAYGACDGPLTWPEARDRCRALGMELVVLDSETKNTFVTNFANPVTRGYWIGLRDRNIEGEFVWMGGAPLGYENFREGEPNDNMNNEDCVEIEQQPPNQWDDKTCSIAQGYICEAPHGV